jgi:hypothetical protein
MPDRIDFALEPGVIFFTALFVVLLLVLVAAAVYPYLSSGTSGEDEPSDFVDDTPTDPKVLEKRVDHFVAEMEGERT